jgi:hypothetical protein
VQAKVPAITFCICLLACSCPGYLELRYEGGQKVIVWTPHNTLYLPLAPVPVDHPREASTHMRAEDMPARRSSPAGQWSRDQLPDAGGMVCVCVCVCHPIPDRTCLCPRPPWQDLVCTQTSIIGGGGAYTPLPSKKTKNVRLCHRLGKTLAAPWRSVS